MKHFWKIITVLMVIGIIFIITGLARGANTDGFYVDKHGLHVSSGEYTLIQERNISTISEISIDVSVANIRLIPAEDYGFELNSRTETNYNFTHENGKLVINRSNSFSFMSLGFNDIGQEYINIYLPPSASLDIVEIRNANGHIDIDFLRCKSAYIHQISGNATISDVEADSITMHTTNGKFEIKNGKANSFDFHVVSGSLVAAGLESGNLTADVTNGKVNLSGTFTGTTQVKVVSGNIQLEIHGSEQEYNRNVSITSGRIRINGIITGSGNVNYNANNLLDIKVTNGNADIDFVA